MPTFLCLLLVILILVPLPILILYLVHLRVLIALLCSLHCRALIMLSCVLIALSFQCYFLPVWGLARGGGDGMGLGMCIYLDGRTPLLTE